MNENQPESQLRRLASKRQVLEAVGLSYPTIWARMREGTFPRSIRVGGKSFWYFDEVAEWINSLPRSALKGDNQPGGKSNPPPNPEPA